MQTAPKNHENAQKLPQSETEFTLSNKNSRMNWLPWLLAIISGGLQVVIFPIPNWNFLCWIALAPLLVALLYAARTSVDRPLTAMRRGFLLGWISGIIFYAGSCYWVYHVMHYYGGLATPVAAGVLILFCLYVGLVHGLFGGLLTWVASRPNWGQRGLILAAPFLWVGAELFRARVIGFPWDLLGTVLVDNIPLSRIASVTGVYGLSFEIALMNAALVAILYGRRERRVLMFAAAILIIGIVETGSYMEPPKAIPTGTARLVQQNISLDQRWTPQTYEQTLADLTQISVPHPGDGMPGDPLPDLIIWPESPAPFFANDVYFRQALSTIAIDAHAYVLAGTLGVQRSGDESKLFNSAELVAPNGDWVARYDKIHLVPFGEYVPFQDMFSFAKKLTKEVGDFVRGTERLVLPVHSYKLGTFICYESIFPDEIREFARNGAGLLVNISNDGWFGDTGAPGQHLRMARMRAVENDRWVLRSTNTGITATIDPYGRIVQQARRNVRVAVDMPYGVVTGTTFYTRHGDWFAWFCVIACAIIAGLALFGRPLFRTGKTTS
jgi:apolipoprotein N-acyltransferase